MLAILTKEAILNNNLYWISMKVSLLCVLSCQYFNYTHINLNEKCLTFSVVVPPLRSYSDHMYQMIQISSLLLFRALSVVIETDVATPGN